MRVFLKILALAILIAVPASPGSDSSIEFHMAVGDYFDIPYENVCDLGQDGLEDDVS